MKWLGWAIAGVALLAVAILAAGYALPRQHVARVRAHYHQPPEALFDAIIDIENGAAWRSGLDSVRVVTRDPLTWRESAAWGALTFVMDDAVRPSRVVTRIADTGEGFGGTWRYEIAPEAAGSVVVITEHGEVDNPLYRFMSKFVFGHHTALETYAADLGRKFGENVPVERVKPFR
ncbi:MAG: SRPBCC family protein [Gemmatimonadota bacterium]